MACVFPHSAVGWSMVCDLWHFLIYLAKYSLAFLLLVMLYQGILLTERFQRLCCVMNNQNEIGSDAYAAKSLS